MAKMMTPAIERLSQKKNGKQSKYSFWGDAWKRLKRNPTAIVGLVIIVLLLLVGIFANVIAPYDPSEAIYADAYQGPSAAHWFGTDSQGRDLFSRCVYGARYSLPIGIACMLGALIVGGIIGLIASFFGGKTDMVTMRIMDVFQAIPGTLFAIVIVAVLGNGMWQLIVAITVSFVPHFSKAVRAGIFQVRNNEWVEACKSIGASNVRLMFRHMIPNAVGYVLIFAVGIISASIMTISSLSYIGLGLKSPTPEWGVLLNAGRTYMDSYPYMIVFPGLMILITILALNLLSDGLRDALDPRLK